MKFIFYLVLLTPNMLYTGSLVQFMKFVLFSSLMCHVLRKSIKHFLFVDLISKRKFASSPLVFQSWSFTYTKNIHNMNANNILKMQPEIGDITSPRLFIKNYKLLLAKERDGSPERNRNSTAGSRHQRIPKMVILSMDEDVRKVCCHLSPSKLLEGREENNPLYDADIFPSGELVALENRKQPLLSEELASVTAVTHDYVTICYTDPDPCFRGVLRTLVSSEDLVTMTRHEPHSNHKRHWDAMNDIDYLNPSPMLQSLFGLCSTPELPDLDEIETPFCNKDLNRVQRETVKFCLAQPHLAVVHGPPGTGKTTTLVEIVIQMIIDKKKILLCAPSNSAVDNIAKSLLGSKYLPKLSTDLKKRKQMKRMRRPKIVRLVAPGREVPPEVMDWTLDALVAQTDFGRNELPELKRQIQDLEVVREAPKALQ